MIEYVDDILSDSVLLFRGVVIFAKHWFVAELDARTLVKARQRLKIVFFASRLLPDFSLFWAAWIPTPSPPEMPRIQIPRIARVHSKRRT